MCWAVKYWSDISRLNIICISECNRITYKLLDKYYHHLLFVVLNGSFRKGNNFCPHRIAFIQKFVLIIILNRIIPESKTQFSPEPQKYNGDFLWIDFVYFNLGSWTQYIYVFFKKSFWTIFFLLFSCSISIAKAINFISLKHPLTNWFGKKSFDPHCDLRGKKNHPVAQRIRCGPVPLGYKRKLEDVLVPMNSCYCLLNILEQYYYSYLGQFDFALIFVLRITCAFLDVNVWLSRF